MDSKITQLPTDIFKILLIYFDNESIVRFFRLSKKFNLLDSVNYKHYINHSQNAIKLLKKLEKISLENKHYTDNHISLLNTFLDIPKISNICTIIKLKYWKDPCRIMNFCREDYFYYISWNIIDSPYSDKLGYQDNDQEYLLPLTDKEKNKILFFGDVIIRIPDLSKFSNNRYLTKDFKLMRNTSVGSTLIHAFDQIHQHTIDVKIIAHRIPLMLGFSLDNGVYVMRYII